MSNGGQSFPRFDGHWTEDRQLSALGYHSWTFRATTTLQIVASNPGPRRPPSSRLSFKLDTGADLSLIPAEWLEGRYKLRQYLSVSDEYIKFKTAAGPKGGVKLGNKEDDPGIGWGRPAKGVQAYFADDPRRQPYLFHFVVSAGLKGYGLLALRDLLRYFTIEMEPVPAFESSGKPGPVPPSIVLVPHDRRRRRYWCPDQDCAAEVTGATGLNLSCNEHGYKLVNSWEQPNLPFPAEPSSP